MSYSEAQKKATMKYIKENKEQISILLPKGKKEVYKAYAKSKGKSLTQYWVDCIESDIAKEKNSEE